MSVDMRPLPFNLPAVPSFERPSASDFDRLKQQGRPFVMRGCLDEWPLCQEFSTLSSVRDKVAYLREHAANERISFVVLPAEIEGHLYFANGLNTSGQRLEQSGSFAEFLEQLTTDPAKPAAVVYMHSTPVDDLPGLGAKVKLLPYVHRSLVEGFNFWIGSGGHIVDLHYDLDHNFICMIAGEKRVILAPPEVMHDVYPRALDRAPYGATAISAKLLDPDFTKFPRLRKAAEKFSVAVLRPREVLYIPPYWWHHVESFRLNVMVNIWQRAVARDEFTPVAVLRRRALRQFAGQREEIRAAYRVRYAREVFRVEGGGASGGETSIPAGRRGPRSLESLFEKTREAISAMPEFVRSAEAIFYDQWVFRPLGDPIENQPGEFQRMIKRLRRDHWKTEFRRFFLRR